MINIAFSFDDGRKDTYRMFYEILKVRNIPFTLNVTTGYINKTIEEKDYPSLNEAMTPEELYDLSKEELVEISGHGRKHNNNIVNFIEGINDIRNQLKISDRIGIASPQCRFDVTNIQDCKKIFDENDVLYLRTGYRFYKYAFIKKVLRRINRLLKNSFIYYFVYNESNIEKNDDYILHSAIVTKYDTLNNIRYFVDKAIEDNKSYIFMFHSILKKNEEFYDDTYSWDYYKFQELCDYLKKLENEKKLKLIKVNDFVRNDLK